LKPNLNVLCFRKPDTLRRKVTRGERKRRQWQRQQTEEKQRRDENDRKRLARQFRLR
jgi:glutamate/tyrosine decarboxylase-like PLP-dependent enzyme